MNPIYTITDIQIALQVLRFKPTDIPIDPAKIKRQKSVCVNIISSDFANVNRASGEWANKQKELNVACAILNSTFTVINENPDSYFKDQPCADSATPRSNSSPNYQRPNPEYNNPQNTSYAYTQPQHAPPFEPASEHYQDRRIMLAASIFVTMILLIVMVLFRQPSEPKYGYLYVETIFSEKFNSKMWTYFSIYKSGLRGQHVNDAESNPVDPIRLPVGAYTLVLRIKPNPLRIKNVKVQPNKVTHIAIRDDQYQSKYEEIRP